MLIRKGQWLLTTVLVLIVLFFTWIFIVNRDAEFIFYVGVIIIVSTIIIVTNKRLKYPTFLLWALILWGLLHMAGGTFFINGIHLYDYILIRLSATLPILRYDQLVHLIGFGASTLLMHHLLKPALQHPVTTPVRHAIVIVMAGLGVGALNEIIEFIVTIFVAQPIGGFQNSMLDLIFDLIGAVLALFIIRKQ